SYPNSIVKTEQTDYFGKRGQNSIRRCFLKRLASIRTGGDAPDRNFGSSRRLNVHYHITYVKSFIRLKLQPDQGGQQHIWGRLDVAGVFGPNNGGEKRCQFQISEEFAGIRPGLVRAKR